MTTKPKPWAEGLRKLMNEHRLTYRDVAELACVSPKTVEGWLATPGSAMHRNMPQRHLQVIGHMLPSWKAKRRQTGKKGWTK